MEQGRIDYIKLKNNYSAIYRSIICCIAAAAIMACGVLKLSDFFTPSNLADITLDNQIKYVLTPAQNRNFTPINEGLFKDEIYLVEQVSPSSEPIEEKHDVKDDTPNTAAYPIVEMDMSRGAAKGEILINDTDSGVSVDTTQMLYSIYPKSLKNSTLSNEPLVLIIHTHATECYMKDGVESYTADTTFRTRDTSENMVAIGDIMEQILNDAGIPTLHCETLHDAESYNASYENSLASVKEYLAKYPSIKYVFDLHRDAIIRESGEIIKTECSINGEKSAQVMTLVGTNTLGADHPMWKDNLNVAIKLQKQLTTNYNGFARPINMRGASFNQQYAPGFLLFEIGSCGNTLDEAKTAVTHLSKEVAQLILSKTV